MKDDEHNRKIWEAIFKDPPEAWSSVPPNQLMFDCAAFLRDQGVRRVLDLGSGFGRWSTFLSGELECTVVGLDYAFAGGRLGQLLAPRTERLAFVTGEIGHLPFADDSFDSFLAVLILDNVLEPEGRRAIRELTRVVEGDAPGLVVLNPWPMPPSAEAGDNPTASCRRRDYDDSEALELLGSGEWTVLEQTREEHGLRVYRVRTGTSLT